MPENFLNQGEEQKSPLEKRRPFHQSDVPAGGIKQRHIAGCIVFSGVAANRPDGTTEVKCWWSTDSHVLSIWDGSQWRDSTFT